MRTIGVIVIYVLIIIMELTPLWKDKKNKEVIVYLSIMTVSLIISICLVSGVKIPTISSILTKIFYRE